MRVGLVENPEIDAKSRRGVVTAIGDRAGVCREAAKGLQTSGAKALDRENRRDADGQPVRDLARVIDRQEGLFEIDAERRAARAQPGKEIGVEARVEPAIGIDEDGEARAVVEFEIGAAAGNDEQILIRLEIARGQRAAGR